MIAIDIETYEADLDKLGPGYHRKDSAIFCVGLYDGRDFECVTPDDPRLRDWLSSDEEKVFHNSVYDLSWLTHGYGFKINGILHDTMTRAALINEYEDYDLDSCCKRFGVQGKNYEDTIARWFEGIKKVWGLRGDVWDNIDVLWAHEEGKKQLIKYNKQDCIATYNLFKAQESYMYQHREPYKLECDIQPIILMLNGNGFPIDIVARDNLTAQIEKLQKEGDEILKYQYGITNETVKSSKQMGEKMTELGIVSPIKTAKGAMSWNAQALSELEDQYDCIRHIQNAKKYNILLDNFLRGSLQRGLVNGKAYSVFSPNKRDDSGTKTGRFSSRTINLQQIPARDENMYGVKSYGTEMRSLFIAEPGCLLGSWDYSSIEMYGLAHYSIGQKSDIFRQQAFAHADFHTMAMDLSGLTVRQWAKTLNFQVIYGSGPRGIYERAKKTWVSLENTKAVYNKYHEGMPFVRATMQAIENETRQQGYTLSIGNRVHHKPKPYYDSERQTWSDGLYKMTNYKIQGMAADTLKKGLLDAYNAGVFSVLKIHATVHDENIASVPITSEGFEAAIQLQTCMEGSFKERWTVPITTSGSIGTSWGSEGEELWGRIKKGEVTADDIKNGKVKCEC